MYWVYKALQNYTNFSGRAGRREYWSLFLFLAITDSGFGLLYWIPTALGYEAEAGPSKVAMLLLAGVLLLVGLSLVLPSVSAMVRRLHDLDKSGLWAFLVFLPIVGDIWLIGLLASEGTAGPNRFGEEPEETAAEPAPEIAAQQEADGPETEESETEQPEAEQPEAEEPEVGKPTAYFEQPIVVTGLALSRAEAAFGGEVTAEVEYQNPADEDCLAEIKLYLNGVAVISRFVEVSARASGTVELPVPYGFVGEYAVRAGEFSQTLIVF